MERKNNNGIFDDMEVGRFGSQNVGSVPCTLPNGEVMDHKKADAIFDIECNDKWSGVVNFENVITSLCRDSPSASVTATLLGDGSETFPYEMTVRKEPPNAFTCSNLCPTTTTTTTTVSGTDDVNHALMRSVCAPYAALLLLIHLL